MGLILLYAGYRQIALDINQREHEESFARVQHLGGTSLVDSLSMKFEYYPATYIDDLINFKSAFLVGELRRYSGNWESIQIFYSNKKVEDGIPIMVMPVEFHADGQQTSPDVAEGPAFSPFDYDVLSTIQNHYRYLGMPQGLKEAEPNLYIVYCVWP